MTTKPEIASPLPEETIQDNNPVDGCQHQDSQEDLHGKLKQDVIEVLSNIFDPEIPVNIYELGLIYKIEVDSMDNVYIQMTLTSPHCPVAESLPNDVKNQTRQLEGVTDVCVDLTWEPPWGPDRMSEAAKLELGFI